MRAPAGFSRAFLNARILLLTEAANAATGMVLVVLLARVLDPGALGLFSFSFALGSVLAIACLFGANNLITREVARDPSSFDSLLGNSLALRGAIAAALLSGCFALLPPLGYRGDRLRVAALLILARLFESFVLMLCSFFRGHQEMRYEAAARVALNAAYLGLSIPALLHWRSLPAFAAVQCAATVLVFVGTYALLLRRYRARPLSAVSSAACADLFRKGLSFSVHAMMLVVYIQTNTLLLSMIRGDEETGYYTAAYRFVSAAGMIALSASGALLPAVSTLDPVRDASQIVRLFARCARYLLALGSLFALVLFWHAEDLISLFYGARFGRSALDLRLMAFTVVLSYLNTASTAVLFSVNGERAVLRVLGASLVFVFAANAALLPPLGHVGASLTTILPEVLVAGLLASAVRRALGPSGLASIAARYALLSAGVSACLWPAAGLPLPARAALLGALYCAGLPALGLVGKGDFAPSPASPPRAAPLEEAAHV